MQTVILCGGKGTRLRPLTKKVPKSMIRIEGRPFLEYQLTLLKKNGIKDIILCVGYKAQQIEEYFGNGKDFNVSIQYSKEAKPLGTGGALKNAEKILADQFLVMYGDSYLLFDFKKAIQTFRFSKKLGLMVVYKNNNRYEKNNTLVEKNLVKDYDKNNPTKEFQHIDYGVSIFRKSVLNSFPRSSFDLSEIHQFLIKNTQLLAFEAKQRFYQIGSPQGLEEFRKYVKKINLKL